MSRTICFLGLAVLCVLGTGCQMVASPTAQVQSVEITDMTDEAAQVTVLVAMSNPNDIALPLTEGSYRVSIDGLGDFDFTDRLARTIPANGQQVVPLPASFKTNGQAVAARAARVTGSITYQPPGEVRALLTESGIPLPSVGFGGDTEVTW